MCGIIINDGKDICFYTQGEEAKIYATVEEAMEEIKGLQEMEKKLFNDIKIKYEVVRINGQAFFICDN